MLPRRRSCRERPCRPPRSRSMAPGREGTILEPMRHHRFKFTILGRYPARIKDNETAVTLNVASGDENHLVYAGTLTMSESEWEALYRALHASLKQRVEVEDHTPE